jgi:flagellar protein FlbT
MSLKLHLKPNEKIIIGGAVIKCGSHAVDFTVENNVPILRQKDIMTEAGATTPSQRVYFMLQLMYVDSAADTAHYHDFYRELEQEIVIAAPSTRRLFEEINREITAGKMYQALKVAQTLITYEKELIAHTTSALVVV